MLTPILSSACLLLLFAIGTASAEVPVEVAKQRIAVSDERYLIAYNTFDADRLAPLYTFDAVQTVPGYPYVKGRKNIVEAFRTSFTGVIKLEFNTTSIVRVSKGVYVSRGTYVTYMAAPAAPGGMEPSYGTFRTVYRFVNGIPLISREESTEVSKLPAPTPKPSAMSKAVVLQLERFLIAVAKRNWSKVGSFYAPDVEFINTLTGGEVVRGRSNAVQLIRTADSAVVLRRTSDVRVVPTGAGQFVLTTEVEAVVKANGGVRVDSAEQKFTWKVLRGMKDPVITKLEVLPSVSHVTKQKQIQKKVIW